MSHGTGRHRRRRRGWACRMRWAMVAVLAVIVGAEPEVKTAASRYAEPGAPRKTRNPGSAVRCREPEWVRRYDQARQAQQARAEALLAGGGKAVGRGGAVSPPEPGWCVDDDGMRAVRPYLVAHEQRQRSGRQRVLERETRRTRHQAEALTASGPGVGACGEWDELAALVRQWKAQRVPVA